VFSGSNNTSSRPSSNSDLFLIAAVVAVMVYTLLTGWGLLSMRIPAERGDALMALPCLLPGLWYLFGFISADRNDFGLILSSLGWFLAALMLFGRQSRINAALAQGMAFDQIPGSPLSWVVALLSVASLVAGAILSARYWKAQSTSDDLFNP
jgi:hypothetical protein